MLFHIVYSIRSRWLKTFYLQVVPELSAPIALFSYYNPILKRGVEKFMNTVKDAGVHGNVVLFLYIICACKRHILSSINVSFAQASYPWP